MLLYVDQINTTFVVLDEVQVVTCCDRAIPTPSSKCMLNLLVIHPYACLICM